MKYENGDVLLSNHVMFCSFEVINVDLEKRKYRLAENDEKGEVVDYFDIDACELENGENFTLL